MSTDTHMYRVSGDSYNTSPSCEVPRSCRPVGTITKLYEVPLPSTRTGALYNAFSYPTKISPEAIAVYIATHTNPGETILDAFAGSGTTGLATLLCDSPTPEMKKIAKSLGVQPKWGARHAHLFEVGVLGAFVSKTLCHPPNPEVFASALEKLCQQAQESIGWVYESENEAGQIGVLRHAIWSDVLVCPHCKAETSLWDASVKTNPLVMIDTFRCQGCHKLVAIASCERANEVVTDVFGQKQFTKKRVLARIHGRNSSTKWQRPPTEEDYHVLEEVSKTTPPKSAPYADIQWGELRRAGYHLGIDKLHHFYTKRNFIVMSSLMEIASTFPSDTRDALRLLILSYNASHSTLMTRVVLKKGQKDFVLTGSQSGVLYISGLPVEKNIIDGIRRKSKTLINSFKLLQGSRSRVAVHNISSEAMPIMDRSVDYIFTDPPFGAYIPYAEVNQINELWLGCTTDRTREVIVSPSQSKGVSEYGIMLETIFKEMARVLKPEGIATVVFHSAYSDVWRALIQAYTKAGFTVEAANILDKIQASFNQTVSNIFVKGDPLLLLSKRHADRTNVHSCSKIAHDMIRAAQNLGKCDPQRLYSQFVRKCLELGVDVTIDAKMFYALARHVTLSTPSGG